MNKIGGENKDWANKYIAHHLFSYADRAIIFLKITHIKNVLS